MSQVYSATLHEIKAAHFIFGTSFEQQQSTTNHSQSNEEEVYGSAWQCHQEGKINILQEIERGDPQEGTAEGQRDGRVEGEVDGRAPGCKNR